MADLSQANLNPNVPENTGTFTVVPAGKYSACLVGDELKNNKAKTGKVLELKVQITAGQFAGEVIKDNLNITNPSQTAQNIGQGTLKRICNLCGVPYPPQDTGGLMGKPLEINVKIEKFTSNTSGKELDANKIKAYGPPAMQQTQQPSTQQTNSW